MRTIGTDVSLDICKAEGYLMMSFDASKKFTPYIDCHFTAHYPEYVGIDSLSVDITLSLTDVYEIYENHKQGVDQCCGVQYQSINDIQSYESFLSFADSVNSYVGLE